MTLLYDIKHTLYIKKIYCLVWIILQKICIFINLDPCKIPVMFWKHVALWCNAFCYVAKWHHHLKVKDSQQSRCCVCFCFFVVPCTQSTEHSTCTSSSIWPLISPAGQCAVRPNRWWKRRQTYQSNEISTAHGHVRGLLSKTHFQSVNTNMHGIAILKCLYS